MKKFVNKNWLYLVGAAVGAIAGYIYYQQIGCSTGTCMITSKPLNSTVYFAVMGALLFGMFKKKPMPNNSFQELMNGDKPVLVDFTATWCGPCKMQAPILKDLKDQVQDAVTIIKIDVDKNPQAAQAYQVQGVPTLIVFQKGQILWRKSGVSTAKELKQVLDTKTLPV